VLYAQQDAWNAGDLESFVEHGYWPSEELTFFSGGTVTRGFGPLLDRYERRYRGTPAAMGELSFSDLESLPLSHDSAVVRGRWRLEFADRPATGGLFTLVLRKHHGRWLIVHDHTSSAE
jgi:beta-aspartyl-peptidase (threonine type)